MHQPQSILRVGLIVNPVAGVGGAVGLKGSDGESTQREAFRLGAKTRSNVRAQTFLEHLQQLNVVSKKNILWFAPPGKMGGVALQQCDFAYTQVGAATNGGENTTALDTAHAVAELQKSKIDLLVFVGGDGTARDILSNVAPNLPVVGIPAGVKMHSGVFAVTPRTGAELLSRLVLGVEGSGGFVAKAYREVRDYAAPSPKQLSPNDKEHQAIQVKTFGELCVPDLGGYLQQTKVGGLESEPLALEEIRAFMGEHLPTDRNIVFGPGSTIASIKQQQGIAATLRGFDVRHNDGQIDLDVSSSFLEALTRPLLVVSFTRQQGFLFGRGNQQLSSIFLQTLTWQKDVFVVATRTKLNSLNGRPILVDTGNNELDHALSGLVEIIAGYDDLLLHRITCEAY